MIRRPPRSTRTDTLFPYPTLFRSSTAARLKLKGIDGGPHKRWSMWFNSTQRAEPYQPLTCPSRARETGSFGSAGRNTGDRKSVVLGRSVSVRVDLGGRRIIKKKIHSQSSIETK